MTVYFTSTEIQQIQQWHNDGLLAGNRSAMYLGIAGILENKLSTASETDQASLRQDILWMQGASQANLGQGVYATLIRSYTQAQAQLRLGGSVTDDLMQQASNAVGDAVFNTIIDPANYKAVPDISVIAKQDATAVGNTIFSSIPLDSGKSHNAGWSGGVLFSLLGSDQTAVLLTNGNSLENLDDARNVLFAMYSLTQALQAAWETGKDEAIEYFDSLVQGGGSGPLATDLSIGFSTFTSASDFVQPAVNFFRHTGLFGAVTEFAQYGLSDILDFMRSTVAGAVVSGTSDTSFAPNAYAFFSKYADSLTSWSVSLPDPDTLLADALNPTSAGDAYRNALAALSPIVIAGMPLSGRDVSLWQAGMTSGLTPDYLAARADMLKLELQYDSSGDSVGSVIHELSFSSQAYYDLAISSNALYTKSGYLSSTTDITMFGGVGPETLKGGTGDDRLFAGSGADVLDGGAGSNTLEGGSGVDTFLVDQGSTGSDVILDVDRKGQILFENGSEVALVGGMQVAKDTWESADGKFVYTLQGVSGGAQDLMISGLGETAVVEDFVNGQDGITLQAAPPPSQPGGLQITSANSNAEGNYGPGPEFIDDGSTAAIAASLLGPNDPSGQVWEIDGASNASSIYGGTGSEWLVADTRTFGAQGITDGGSVYMQAGSGAQTLIGGQGHDTLVGGSDTLSSATVTFEPGTGPYDESAPYTMAGSQGFDWITGGGGDDLIEAGSGSALIDGGMGGDTIIGGSGNDSIYAGTGFYPEAFPGHTVINLYDPTGVQSDVYVTGIIGDNFGANAGMVGSKANLIIAGSGNDLITGSWGDDTIYGGSGVDTIVGNNGNKTIYGGSGGGVIYADENYALEEDAASGSPYYTQNWADAGKSYSDTIYGGSGATTIYGSGGNDYLYAGGGNDTIYAGNGNSFVYGDSGNVAIVGGTGNEVIDAGSGNDYIEVGDGNSYVYAGLGDSTVIAGAGKDTIEAGGGTDTLIGGSGAVTYVIGTSTGADTIELGTGSTNIQLVGGLTETGLVVRYVNGDLVLSDLYSDTQVTVSGYFKNGGNVAFTFEDGTTWGAAQIAQAAMTPSNGGNDTLVGFNGNDSITAGIGDTLIVGTTGNNTLTGGPGEDTIEGGSGNDSITAGIGDTLIVDNAGANTIFGGDGSDTIQSGSGNDSITAGSGDTLITDSAGANTIIGGEGNDTIQAGSGNDRITAGSGNTLIVDAGGNNTLVGGAGDDTIRAGTGKDSITAGTGDTLIVDAGGDNTITGGAGNDTIQAGSGNDRITAGSGDTLIVDAGGNNTLTGGAGHDTIQGGSGADTIEGGTGTTLIQGGSGQETYLFNLGDGSSTISPSSAGPGNDVLRLGTGITMADLAFGQFGANGLNMIITDPNTGTKSSVVVEGYFNGGNSSQHTVQIVLADGTTLDPQTIESGITVFYGDGSGGEIITSTVIGGTYYAGDGQDVAVLGGPGNDLIYGGSQTDTLVGGNAGDNTIIAGSGDDLIQGGTQNDTIKLGGGNATVTASPGNDTYEWDGTGQQVIKGYGGVYGDGVQTYEGYNRSEIVLGAAPYGGLQEGLGPLKTGSDTWQIGGGLTPNDLAFQLDGTGIKIVVAGTDASLSIGDISTPDMDGQYGINAIQFSNGETLSRAQILQKAVAESEWLSNSEIYVPAGQQISVSGKDDTLVAGDGNDTIVATPGSSEILLAGSNTIEFGRGSGEDFVLNTDLAALNAEEYTYPAPTGSLVVQLAQGVRPEDVQIVEVADQYGNSPGYESIRINGTTDQLNIGEQWNGDTGNLDLTLQFADGTTWGALDIAAHTVTAPFVAPGVISFGYGSGVQTESEAATIQMQPGITPDTVEVNVVANGDFAHPSYQYVLTLKGTGDSLSLDPSQVGEIQFSDGTTWHSSDLENLAFSPRAGGGQYITDFSGNDVTLTAEGNGDTLQAGTGNDTLDPGVGNTLMLASSQGNTTFLYNGGGDDTVLGNSSSVLQLGPGITESDITYAVDAHGVDGGVDLILTDQTTGKTLDLANYFGNGTAEGYNYSTPIQFADGTVVGGWSPSPSTLTDTRGHTVLISGNGSESLSSSGEGDTIFAAWYDDAIAVGAGDDTIVTAPGFETIETGGGNYVMAGGGYVSLGNGTGHDSLVSGYYQVNVQNTLVNGLGINETSTGAIEIYSKESGDSVYISPAVSFDLKFSDGVDLNRSNIGAFGKVIADPNLVMGSTGATAFTFNALNDGGGVADYASGDFTLTMGDGLLGQAIRPSDVSIVESGADLVLRIADPGNGQGTDTFTLKNYYRPVQAADGTTGYASAPFTVQFADGTTWNDGIIQSLIARAPSVAAPSNVWLAQPGGQSFVAPNHGSNDLYDTVTEVNEGDNSITFGGQYGYPASIALDPAASGADTLTWDFGSNDIGSTTISGFKSNDVVQFAPGITPADLMGAARTSADGGISLDIYLADANPANGAYVEFEDFFSSNSPTAGGTFEFSNGTTLSGAAFLGLLDRYDPSAYYAPFENIFDETLLGAAGESLTGGPGNDVLAAGPGDATINGGGGNDTLYTGDGADTFVFGHGSGNATIVGAAAAGVSNTLAFSADVSPGDVSVVRTNAAGTLALILNDSGETVTLPDYLQGASSQSVQQVTFADGTVWTTMTLESMANQPSPMNQYLSASPGHDSLLAGSGADTLVSDGGNDTLVAGAGNDTLYGGSGADLLVAGSGNALMLGGSGNETFQFGTGFGQDTVVVDAASSNTIQFTGGVTAADVTLSTNNSDLVLKIAGGGSIVLPDALVWNAPSSLTLTYADGSSQSLSQLLTQLPGYMAASPGNDSLVAGSGADTLVADSGNDTLVAGSGADTLIAGSGTDVLIAGTGNDLLVGGSGMATFQIGAAAGADTVSAMSPSAGSNTLQFTTDVADIALSEGPSSADGNVDLNIVVHDSDGWTSTLTLSNHFQGGSAVNDIGQIAFQDGSSLSMASIDQWLSLANGSSLEIAGSGNETVNADYGALVVAGRGNELVNLGDSATLLMQAGFAQDTVALGSNDTIQFAAGITPGDIQYQQQGNDLVLSDSQGGTIDLQNWFDPEGPTSYALQAITFADGTSWTPGTTSAFNTLETAGVDNGESVAGGSGDDTLVADAANDTLTGGTGTQTFRFGSGFGQDTLVLNDAASANTIQFEAGINASEVSFASNGTDLVMTVTGSTGTDGQPSTLTLPNYLGGTASTITTRILFGDGVSISMAQINQLLQQSGGAPVQYTGTVLTAGAGDVSLSSDGGIDTLIGGAGNDTLIGGDGQDLLELGSGNTQINGGNGQETYQFSPGFGQDTLTPSGPADANTIRFGGGITAADVSFSLDYSSLLVTVGNSIGADGQASTITLPVYHGYINGNETTSTNIGQFIFADGSTASMAQLFELLAQSNGQPVHYSGGTTLTAGAGNELLEGDGSANTLIGGAGGDTLMGNYGQDLLEAGTGNSLLIGGTGDETYQFVSGFGQDTITANPAARGNTIQFIGDISPDKVTFESDSSDLLILLDGSVGPDGQPSVIRVPDYFAGNGTGALSQIVFGNGTVAPMGAIDQLLKQSSGAPVHYVPPGTVITAGPGNVEITSDNGNDTLIGGTGNDTLVGGSGTDVLEAGTGNDLLVGGSGRETYTFGSGFGQDTITADAAGTSNSIRFGAGISAADLSFQAAGDNLVISVAGSVGADGLPSQVTLLNYFSDGAPATDFGQITFSDGSTIAMTRVNQALAASSTLEGTVVQVVPAGVLITAPNNKDTLTGIDGDDTLNAGSGQDVLQAGSGNDVLNAGIGKDILVGGSGNDTLNGGSGNDLLQAGTGNDVLKAGSGKNTLIGGSGVDLLVAGTGPDIMQGGTGTQTYEFGTSFGKTTIEVSPNEQGANTIHFTGGVAPADLSYKQHKSDLVITVTVDGSSSTIIISNHFASGLPAANDVSELTFADGSVVTMAQINQQFAGDQLHTSSTNGLHWANGGFDDPAPHMLQPALSGLDGSHQGGFRGMSQGFANGVMPANPYTAPLQVNDSEKLALPTWSGSSGAAAPGAESYSPGEPSIPTNGIGLPSLPATMQPMSGSREAPGAPVDPLTDDPDDVSVQRSDNWLWGADAAVAPREDVTASAWSSSLARSLVRGGGVHAAHVANDMVKALRAQADLRASGMESSAQSPAQIQLQGGAIWSLSTLDRTLAALSFAGDALPASRGYASASGADLAHAQLVSAMASFSPLAAAESIPPDVTSEAYAIALAVHAH